MSCEKLDQVHAYHDGELAPAAAVQTMQAHLAVCGECARLLDDLRQLSGMVAGAGLPEMPERAMSRFYGSWHAARDRGVLHVASWLTAAAAALLMGAILVRPSTTGGAGAKSSAWEVTAVTPHIDAPAESNSELVQVAQWMSDDLSLGGR